MNRILSGSQSCNPENHVNPVKKSGVIRMSALAPVQSVVLLAEFSVLPDVGIVQ
jgi:hypothetical protein